MSNRIEIPASESDFYLANPPNQPKRVIGDYVEDEGFQVPARFDTVEAGFLAQDELVLRSEHPLEYAGPSAMLSSLEIRKSIDGGTNHDHITPIGWFNYSLGSGMTGTENHRRIADAYGYDWDEYVNSVGFSTWSVVRGLNRAMFADPANEDRYFVGSVGVRRDQGGKPRGIASAFHVISENGETEAYQSDGFDDNLPAAYGTAEELARFYEGIKRLGHFDPEHCPIIEFQSDIETGSQWFLQYHRGRDTRISGFEIDEDLEGTEMKHIIGATAQDGEDMEVAIGFADGRPIDFYQHAAKTELVARLDIPTMTIDEDITDTFFVGTHQHGLRSLWAKSPIALFHETGDKDLAGIFDGKVRTREVLPGVDLMFADLNVISDGKRAFVKSS